jgi:hypothetical protein
VSLFTEGIYLSLYWDMRPPAARATVKIPVTRTGKGLRPESYIENDEDSGRVPPSQKAIILY